MSTITPLTFRPVLSYNDSVWVISRCDAPPGHWPMATRMSFGQSLLEAGLRE